MAVHAVFNKGSMCKRTKGKSQKLSSLLKMAEIHQAYLVPLKNLCVKSTAVPELAEAETFLKVTSTLPIY